MLKKSDAACSLQCLFNGADMVNAAVRPPKIARWVPELSTKNAFSIQTLERVGLTQNSNLREEWVNERASVSHESVVVP